MASGPQVKILEVSFMTTLYHENKNCSTEALEKYRNYYADVNTITAAGCIVAVKVANGTLPAFVFGNYSLGDKLILSIDRIYTDGRYPKACVESVLSYANDDTIVNSAKYETM